MYLRGLSAKCALVLVSVALAGFGFQATTQSSSPLPAVNTGGGGGYKTTDLQYSLRASDKRLIDEIHFKISPASATHVRAQLVEDGPWYECSVYSGDVSCDTTSPPAEAAHAGDLSVIVSQ
jgi:hypothetical protein